MQFINPLHIAKGDYDTEKGHQEALSYQMGIINGGIEYLFRPRGGLLGVVFEKRICLLTYQQKLPTVSLWMSRFLAI